MTIYSTIFLLTLPYGVFVFSCAFEAYTYNLIPLLFTWFILYFDCTFKAYIYFTIYLYNYTVRVSIICRGRRCGLRVLPHTTTEASNLDRTCPVDQSCRQGRRGGLARTPAESFWALGRLVVRIWGKVLASELG